MKRFVILLCCILYVLSATYAADEYEYIEVDDFDAVVAGEILGKDRPVLSKRNGWLLPARTTCEKLGILEENFKWYPETKTVVLYDNGCVIRVIAGQSQIGINDTYIELENSAVLHKGTLYLPLDFYETALECKVKWDDGNGVIYVQRLEEYNRIYKLLENCTVADVYRAGTLSYEYRSYIEMTDAENGYSINKQERNGKAKYNLKGGECSEEGVFSRWGREFSFENCYKNSALYKTMFGETEIINDSEEINLFKESVLNNAFLAKVDNKLKELPIVSADANAFSLSELEKKALVLKTAVDNKRDVVLVYGSLLGIQDPLHQPGIIDEQVSYAIDSKCGRLLEINQKSTTQEIVYGITVQIYAELNRKYAVK